MSKRYEGIGGISLFLGGQFHSQPCRGANRGQEVSVDSATHERQVRPIRAGDAFAIALCPGTDNADFANDGLQPASFSGLATIEEIINIASKVSLKVTAGYSHSKAKKPKVGATESHIPPELLNSVVMYTHSHGTPL